MLVSKFDHKGRLAVVALNSEHLLYCQLIFYCPDTAIASSLKLYNMVGANDSPPFNYRGKTSLIVDDLKWTNSDAFVVLAF